MSLHTVSKSPEAHDALQSCLRLAVAGDALLLIEDGVYAAAGSQAWLVELAADISVYALQEDLQARGLAARIDPRIKVLDYAGFVELACQHDKSISWF